MKRNMLSASRFAGVLLLSMVAASSAYAGTGDGSVLSITKIQDNGPDTARFNIVIMGDGYQASEMAAFEAQALAFVNAFNSQVTFGACAGGVNFYRVNVQSTDSGSDKPAPCYSTPVSKNTYLDSRYCGNGSTQRCIWSTNTGLVEATAAMATANWHYVVVLVKDPEHGGCAGSNLTFNSTGGGFETIVLHELGHALGGLADEYEYDSSVDTYTGGEPGSPNLTIETNRASIKWFDLIAPTTAIPTWNRPDCTNANLEPPAALEDVIGIHEGGGYHRCGIYRPDRSCLMRVLSADLCEVCSRRVRQVMQVHFSEGNLSITPWGYYKDPKVHPFWQTPDVWADNDSDGIQEADEPSIGRPDNRLFARVTNTGTLPSGPFQVRFSYVPFTGVIDLANAQVIGTVSRPSLATGGVDVVETLWPLDAIPPAFAGINHFCVIVEILHDECATHDNRAQNNFVDVPTIGPSPAPVSFFIENPLPTPAVGAVRIEPEAAGWRFKGNVPDLGHIPLQPKERKLIVVEFSYPAAGGETEPRDVGEGDPQLDMTVRQQFDLTFLLNGQIVGGVSPAVTVQPGRQNGFSLHLGRTDPRGTFDQRYDSDTSFNLDLDHKLAPRLWVVGLLGYHRFKPDASGGGDLSWWSVSANLKYEIAYVTPLRFFVQGGFGVYIPDSGSTEAGYNLGVGVDYRFRPQWDLEIGTQYHRLPSPDIDFLLPYAGLIYRF